MTVLCRRLSVSLIALVVCGGAVLAQAKLSKADATKFQAKLLQIQKNAETPRKPNAPARSTQMTDVEVNAYLKYLAGDQVPVGIVEPTLHAAGNGRITGRAVVDLDVVRTSKKRGWTDPLGYLMGRLPVTAAGTLTTENGVGRFKLESAEISGLTVPKSLLQELLTFYSKSAENPNGINMDDPFQLPAAIREIKVGQGVATVVQ